MPDLIQDLKYNYPTTFKLLLINVVVFAISILLRILSPSEGEIAYLLGAVYGASSLIEVWRLITASFLHIDIFHIALNCFALFYYGKFIESFYSSKKLLIIYVVSGVGGSFLAALTFPGLTLGASGAIWGFLGVILGNTLKKNTYSPGLPYETRDILSYTMIWLFAGLLIPGVSFFGHLGGFIAGIILGLFLNTANDFSEEYGRQKIVDYGYKIGWLVIVLSYAALIINIFI